MREIQEENSGLRSYYINVEQLFISEDKCM